MKDISFFSVVGVKQEEEESREENHNAVENLDDNARNASNSAIMQNNVGMLPSHSNAERFVCLS